MKNKYIAKCKDGSKCLNYATKGNYCHKHSQIKNQRQLKGWH